jgi:hypothetical protein
VAAAARRIAELDMGTSRVRRAVGRATSAYDTLDCAVNGSFDDCLSPPRISPAPARNSVSHPRSERHPAGFAAWSVRGQSARNLGSEPRFRRVIEDRVRDPGCDELASKFRVGEEPDPFVLEVDLSVEPWTLRDVTAEMLDKGREATRRALEAREAQRQTATVALAEMVRRQAAEGTPVKRTPAVALLRGAPHGLTRKNARALVDSENGRCWRVEKLEHVQGMPGASGPSGQPAQYSDAPPPMTCASCAACVGSSERRRSSIRSASVRLPMSTYVSPRYSMACGKFGRRRSAYREALTESS